MKNVICTAENESHQFWNVTYVNKKFGFFKFSTRDHGFKWLLVEGANCYNSLLKMSLSSTKKKKKKGLFYKMSLLLAMNCK